MDDDTFVNTYLLIDFINYLKVNHNGLSNKYFCEILENERVDRRPDGKYSITCDEYNRATYDSYCCGIANLITGDLIQKLYSASLNAKYFWVDDIYVGFITNSLNVNMHSISNFIIDTKDSKKRYEASLFVKDTQYKSFESIWKVISKKNSKKRYETNWKNII